MDTPTPEDELNPEYPDPFPTESQVIAAVAKAEFDGLTPEQQADVERRWANRPWWQREDLQDAIEFDLL